MSNSFDTQLPDTWPKEISTFLQDNKEFIIGRYCTCCNTEYSSVHERVYISFQEILKRYSLIGYHCTKLIKEEIDEVQINGMSLQDLDSLSKRIDVLHDLSLIDSEIANDLKTANYADDENRAKMLWFCFFPPYLAGQSGIQGFFDYWGGEALFSSHEYSPLANHISKSGIALQKIGIPCLIKAKVQMSSLAEHCLPVREMFHAFLKSKGHSIEYSTEHEGFSIKSIPPENILEVIKYPSEEFVNLTKCDEWTSYIE